MADCVGNDRGNSCFGFCTRTVEKIMQSNTLAIVIALIVAAIVVLFIMNPVGFSSMIKSVGGQAMGESTILSGSGYRKAN